jgi:hypothetical protein
MEMTKKTWSGLKTCVTPLTPLRPTFTDLIEAILPKTIGHTYNRGLTVPDTYRIMKGVESLSDEEYKLSSVLGWCTGLVRSYRSDCTYTFADNVL